MNKAKGTVTILAALVLSAGLASCGNLTESVKEETISLGNVASIEANLKSTDLRVKLGSENKLRYRVYESIAPSVTQDKDKLSIVSGEGTYFHVVSTQEDNFIELTLTEKQLEDLDIELSSGDVVFNDIDLDGDISTSSGNIEIYGSENGKDVNLTSSTGDITVKNSGFKSLNKKSSSGKSSFENVKTDEAYLESTSGDTTAAGCTFGSLRKKSSTGASQFDDITCGDMNLEASSGSTSLTCTSVCDIVSVSESGDVSIRFPGSRSEFDCELSADSGSISVGGNSYDEDYVDIRGAAHKVKCKTSSGDITIEHN